MTIITLYGHSDDCIELDGDIHEEWEADDSDGDLISFSDGTVLRITYTDDGVWRIVPVAVGTAVVEIVHAPEDDEKDYSDKATIRGDIKWATQGSQIAFVK